MSTVERIAVPNCAEFRARYRDRRQPVVIQGLFAGHPLAQINTVERARERIGAMPIRMARNYMDMNVRNIGDFVAGRPVNLEPETRDITLAEYLDLASAAPDERWIATENVPPAELVAGLDLSPVGVGAIEPGYGKPTDPYEAGKSYSLMFVGSPGNASDLHTDWDGRHVVLYQMFGRKRATVFPTEVAEQLLPIDIYSMVRLRGMAEDRRRAFTESLGGIDVVLEPGDALYMPAFCWHHLEYLDTGMSVNFRFDGPRDADLRFLINNLHRDTYTQNLFTALLDEKRCREHQATLAQLRTECCRDYATGLDKYHALRESCRQAYREVCLRGAAESPFAWINHSDFLDSILCYRYNRPPMDVAP
ncbi:cupin-like domain-containing protein [Methylogaea oryzae]|uniref:JmjC domain-containing protein n=1 Tax=Methylogaea oryzae TaxID=1295382 RepID=A0A8D4VNP0_9GAMM|nr:cupin-like domain-containing protein [Methylogaea oryzae]BBL70956.1 hypothetical protein MoryE10_15620 [Methylogaea oryzae]